MAESYGIDPAYITRLVRQNELAQKDMAPFRKLFKEINKAYVGANYPNGSRKKKPLNQTALFISIMLRQLVANSPQVYVSTPHHELRSVATLLELHVNQSIRNMALPQTIRHSVLNALMLCAVVRMGLAEIGTVRIDGNEHYVGQVFADNVSPDDYIVDMQASVYGNRQFEASRLTIPRDQIIQSSPFITQELMDILKPSMPSDIDATGHKRTASMSRKESQDERLEDEIAAWEFYVPARQLLILLPENPSTIGEVLPHPIYIRTWTGPKRGPYHRLAFDPVADNIMPKPPLSDLFDFDDLINRVSVKHMTQAERQKNLLIVPQGHGDSAKTVSSAPDGAAVTLSDPSKVTHQMIGGVHPQSAAIMMEWINQWSRQAGNPDLMGGLGPQSGTARQDELLNENINKRLDDMRRGVVQFVRGIAEDIGWYTFTDPLLSTALQLKSASGQTVIPITFTANDIRGDFLHYNFDVNPYSMQDATPSGQLQMVTQVWNQAIAPMAPVMLQQQMAPNVRGYLELIGKLGNMPEMNNLVIYQPMPEAPLPEGEMNPSSKPAVTSRTYERINRPGATSQGKRAEMIKMMMGRDSQPGELAQVGSNYGS